MLPFEKKGTAVAIVDRAMPEEKEDGNSEGEITDEHLVATEIIFAIQERKPELLAKALKSFYEMCDVDDDGEPQGMSQGGYAEKAFNSRFAPK